MLKISNLMKTYTGSNTPSVDNLNLDIKPGEIFGFLGTNGAGKTTTIKSITGIIPFDSGNIEINSFDILKKPKEAKKSFGYVSDNHIVYDKLTGKEYVNFMADVYKVSKSERREREEMYLSLFELEKAYNNQIRTYSHGMKQKIHIIGAMIHSPKLWILDEPMTGLDPQSSYNLKDLMHKTCQKGNSVFFSTHILEVAERLCDRVGIIIKGKLIAVGTMDELREKKDETLEELFLKMIDKN